MKKNLLLLAIVAGTEVWAFQRWFSCWLFQSTFYFTPQILFARLLEATNQEVGIPLLEVRMLHNKIFLLPWGISQALLQYFDIRFLEVFIGIVGACGVYLGMWYFFTRYRKSISLWILLGLLVLLSCIEIFHPLPIGFGQRILSLFGIFQIISFFGIWQFLKGGHKRLRYLILIFLILLTIFALVFFRSSFQDFCLKV